MKQKFLFEAKEMARGVGFHDVKHVGKWKGHDVIEPIFTDNETHFIGFPQYLLFKDGALRWAKGYKESLDIMDAVSDARS